MSEIILYTSPDGVAKVEVFFEDESFWLTQRRMAELFGVDVRTINEHIGNIFETDELDREATIRKFRIVQIEGGREVQRELDHYSLDAIIAVGYRVNSRQATRFRIWATNTLKEFIAKGFILDDERLKLNTRFGKDYFEELLERIREIRASERRFYLKITDLYEQASIDYDAKAEITKTFFATVQNKLHWAVSGKTAAEIIAERADANKPTMGLTTWKNAPHGKVLKGDISTAKNYMIETEIRDLNRIVEQYLLYAEGLAERRVPMKMAEWVDRLDAFLKFNERDVLTYPGRVSAEVARKLAEEQYEKFRVNQDQTFESDFERESKRIESELSG
ncbi:virulence RhuM family protein [Armatimonas sp.]|uniref:virulence RhuM family protein n=1 Tax=Armatimonas sp. TaxID=1872638 RepID=UPI00286B6076|nr:virulence RhuM family protein [Armatimonas sp.]